MTLQVRIGPAGRSRRFAGMVTGLVLALAIAGAARAETNPTWDVNDFPLPYYFNEANAPASVTADFATDVTDSVRQWNQAVCSSMRFVSLGYANRTGNNFDGLNTFTWSATGEGMMDPLIPARTYVRTDPTGQTIIECDTVLNGHPDVKWSSSGNPLEDEFDVRSVIVREVGRWVQLPFLTDPEFSDRVMFDPLETGQVKQTLAQGDLDALCAIYTAEHVPDWYEPDDTSDWASYIALDSPQNDHSIYPASDEDWLTFDLYEMASIRVTTTGTDPEGDTELWLYDEDLTLIAHNDNPLTVPPGVYPLYAVLDAPGLAAGTYYIKVASYGNLMVVDPYAISVTSNAVDAYESDDILDDARRIYADQPQPRSIRPVGDVDYAYFVINELRRVIVETSSTQEPAGDTVLELYDEYSGVIAENDDKSPADHYSRIDVPSLEPGNYYLRIRQKGDTSEIIAYTLTLQVLEPMCDLYEPDDTSVLAHPLLAGQPQAHAICLQDVDWVYVDVSAGDGRVWLSVTAEPENFNDEVALDLYGDPGADPIATGIGTAGSLVSSGRVYARIHERYNLNLVSSYTLTAAVQQVDSYEPDSTPGEAVELVQGMPQTHSIQPGDDEDWCTFELMTSGALTVQTAAELPAYSLTGGDPNGDTEMSLYYETSTNLVRYNDDRPGSMYSQIIYTGAQPGVYWVRIIGLNRRSAINKYFILSTFEPDPVDSYEPDDLPANATVLTSGVASANHSISPLYDKDWYRITVTELSDIEVVSTHTNSSMDLFLFDSSVLSAPDPNQATPIVTAGGQDSVSLDYYEAQPGVYYIKANERGNKKLVPSYSIVATLTRAPAFRSIPPKLYFSGDWQHIPQPQPVTIRHLTQACTWSYQTADAWIVVTDPTPGNTIGPGVTDQVNVSVRYELFQQGSYSGTVTFRCTDSTNSTYTLRIYLTIVESPARVTWNKNTLTYTAVEGAIDPPSQSITFTNSGGGTLINWSLEANPAGWITLDPPSGMLLKSSPSATIAVSPHVAGLLPGVYTARLVLHGFEASPGDPPPQPTVQFTVTVDTVPPQPQNSAFEEGPHGIVGTTSINMSAVETVDEQLAQVFYLFDFMGGEAGGADSGWITSRAFSLPGLVPGGYYTYRAQARDSSSQANKTNFSDKLSGYVAPAVPPAPSVSAPDYASLLITPSRGTSSPRVLLAILNETTGKYLDRRGEPSTDPVWRTEDDWGSVRALGLQGGMEYLFRVAARNGQGMVSGFGPAAQGYTLDNAPPAPAPVFLQPPTFNADQSQVSMTCTESMDQTPPVQYMFEYVGPAGECTSSNWTTLRSYTVASTVPAGDCAFRVKARDATGHETQPSEIMRVYKNPAIPPMPTLVGTPTDSTVNVRVNAGTNSAGAQYAISCKYRVGDYVEYYIDETGNQVPITAPVWRTVSEWGSSIRTKGYMMGSSVTFRVKARNGGGVESEFSPELSATTHLSTDSTAPSPDPMKWDASYTPAVAANSIAIRSVAPNDNTPPITLEFSDNVTDPPVIQTKVYSASSDLTSRSVTFSSLLPCTRHVFRVRARDAQTLNVRWTGYSVDKVIYTMPNPPKKPSLQVIDREQSLIALSISTTDNNPEADTEYAIMVGTANYVDANGAINGTAKAWKHRTEWLATPLTGWSAGIDYTFALYSRNPDGREVRVITSEELTTKIDLTPPNPAAFVNPPGDAVVNSSTGEATLTAVPTEAGASYYFACIDGTQPDSGWVSTNTYKFWPPATAVMSSFTVKCKDAAGNETAPSARAAVLGVISPPELGVPPVPPGKMISRGTSGTSAYMSIDRGTKTYTGGGGKTGTNAKTAEYAIRILKQDGVTIRWLTISGSQTTAAEWHTYDEWGDVVRIGNASSVIDLTVFVRLPGTTGEGLGGDQQAPPMPDGTADTEPPTPATMSFESAPGVGTGAKGTDFLSMTAVAATDAKTWPMYGFQREGQDMVWVWERTYKATGLQPAALYRFRTQAKDMLGNMNTASSYVDGYTAAIVPGAPSAVPQAISVDLTIATAGNPAAVRYAIQDKRSGLFTSAAKVLNSATAVWQTSAEWGATTTVTGIMPNTIYEFQVKAINQSNDETAYGPSTVVTSVKSDGDKPAPNPSTFAVWPAATGTTSFRAEATSATDATPPVTYNFTVQRDEGDTVESGWQESNITNMSNLTPGGRYIVTVQARDFSNYPQQNYTTASAPATLYLDPLQPDQSAASNITATTCRLTLGTKTNSAQTKYAIFETVTGRYLNDAANLAALAPVWRTAAQWGNPITVSGLQCGFTYCFIVAARSGDEAMTPYTQETPVATPVCGGCTPGAPSVAAGDLGVRSFRLTIQPGSCLAAATFGIRLAAGTTKYLQAGGTLGTSEVRQTLAQWGNPVLIRSLAPDTTYAVSVRAEADGQLSDWTAPINVLTNIEGDCDGNNKVNLLDLLFVRNRLNGSIYSGSNFLADPNDDTKINLLDLLLIRNNLNHTRP